METTPVLNELLCQFALKHICMFQSKCWYPHDYYEAYAVYCVNQKIDIETAVSDSFMDNNNFPSFLKCCKNEIKKIVDSLMRFRTSAIPNITTNMNTYGVGAGLPYYRKCMISIDDWNAINDPPRLRYEDSNIAVYCISCKINISNLLDEVKEDIVFLKIGHTTTSSKGRAKQVMQQIKHKYSKAKLDVVFCAPPSAVDLQPESIRNLEAKATQRVGFPLPQMSAEMLELPYPTEWAVATRSDVENLKKTHINSKGAHLQDLRFLDELPLCAEPPWFGELNDKIHEKHYGGYLQAELMKIDEQIRKLKAKRNEVMGKVRAHNNLSPSRPSHSFKPQAWSAHSQSQTPTNIAKTDEEFLKRNFWRRTSNEWVQKIASS